MIKFRQLFDLGGFRITNIGTPTTGTDAATKTYADGKVAKTGDTMSGALNMGTNKVTNLGTPTATTDAATKAYVDSSTSSTGVTTTTTANYVAAATDSVVLVNLTNGTAYLPAAATAGAGKFYTFKNISSTALTLLTQGGNIDTTFLDQLQAYQSCRYVSDGTNWYRVGLGAETDHFFYPQVAQTTANYTATTSDSVILANGSGITVTLPTAASAGSGRVYRVKNINATSLTIASSGGTIDGSASVSTHQWQSLTVASDGANWFII